MRLGRLRLHLRLLPADVALPSLLRLGLRLVPVRLEFTMRAVLHLYFRHPPRQQTLGRVLLHRLDELLLHRVPSTEVILLRASHTCHDARWDGDTMPTANCPVDLEEPRPLLDDVPDQPSLMVDHSDGGTDRRIPPYEVFEMGEE